MDVFAFREELIAEYERFSRTLHALFDAPFGKDLAFKGATWLSRAYRAICRLSEDVDITGFLAISTRL